MIPSDFTIDFADWNNAADREACLRVREIVFVLEQNVPAEDEVDDLDGVSRHVLARDVSGTAIGTGRITPQGVIGRVAVLADWRKRHVGSALVRTLVEQAQALAYPAVEMHAQLDAVPFYEKFGFAVHGDEFVECGIRHVNMRMELAPPSPPERPAPPPRPEAEVVAVDSRETALDRTLALIGDARRDLCVYTRDLDPALFDNDVVLDALKHFAIGARGATVRIIVQEPRVPAQRGHRLIAMAQRLSSAFAFRTPVQDEDLQYPSAFVLNDVRGFYFRTLGNRFDGEAINYAPGKHAQLLEYFNQVWERSEPSDELRQLSL
ncbi:MAG TPA: GNAT family N-acetyltransferase [Rudaea sp.]|jgi:predicted GNAT family N-acyltransferase|nr:GNAT family N-acetyltransferase [Rudaea sp.]